MSLPPYAIVSPVRDEAEHLPTTIASIVGQSHRPVRWIIVDDGSTDGTPDVARALTRDHEWISVIESGRSGARARGGPIVRAFARGRTLLDSSPHEFVVKLDGDLRLPPDYFEWVAEVFRRAPRAGIVGGLVLVPDGTEWVADPVSRRSVNGVAKAYRVACFNDIGGLDDAMGWDGIDEYAARARGWTSHVLTELPILHYKPRGSKQPWWRSRWEEGIGAQHMGYRLPSLLLRVVNRMLRERPPVLGGLMLGAGFAWARLRRRPQVGDAVAVRQLRTEQAARERAFLRGQMNLPPDELPGGGPAFWQSDAGAAAASACGPTPAEPGAQAAGG